MRRAVLSVADLLFLRPPTFVRFNKEASWESSVELEANDRRAVHAWLACPTPRMLIVGELPTGLAFDSAYAAREGKTLKHSPVPLFAIGSSPADLPDEEHVAQPALEARAHAAGWSSRGP